MNKAYIIAPLLALAAFIPFYINFEREHAGEEEAEKEAIRLAGQKKLQDEAEARRKAVEEAIILQEQRKAERAEKDAKDFAEKEARQAAVDARDSAHREQQALGEKVEELANTIEEEKAAIAKIDETQAYYQQELVHLGQYVPLAEQNTQQLQQVLQSIQAADAARAEQERAAAAAAAAQNRRS